MIYFIQNINMLYICNNTGYKYLYKKSEMLNK